ncbi:unnamed protein product [Gadus morhua 'NCC']
MSCTECLVWRWPPIPAVELSSQAWCRGVLPWCGAVFPGLVWSCPPRPGAEVSSPGVEVSSQAWCPPMPGVEVSPTMLVFIQPGFRQLQAAPSVLSYRDRCYSDV